MHDPYIKDKVLIHLVELRFDIVLDHDLREDLFQEFQLYMHLQIHDMLYQVEELYLSLIHI